ncbi:MULTISPECIES: hypothetical protein [Paenibacillus]|uniref:Conjugal transfer protein n=1 Tax=Paenibacillus oralis TaxID=2490856 RepID=A0A3P3T9G1_9BACL|nr:MULTISPECIES: hypothetical protein [Paenibacillus]MEC0373189.1 hypothetical protein [Paenibacillus chibensis]RRJ54592.1 hypothetical protein EHV15_33830 [Paenibacillus oralis]
MEQQRKELWALNDFLKFERRLYQFAGLKFGREIKIKAVLYWLSFSAIEFVWYWIPVLNFPLRLLPESILFALPFAATYLLMDVGTENRPPIKFLKSAAAYHWRKGKRVTYYKGKELEQSKSYGFGGQLAAKDFPVAKKKPNPSYQFRGYFTVDD